MRVSLPTGLLSTGILFLSLSTAARADAISVALTFTGTGTQLSSNFTRGWEFTTSKSIIVQSLGWWDNAGDGLASSHQVSIWDTSGRVLLSATVAAGTTDVLQNGFRFDTTLTGNAYLAPGTYIIGGLSSLNDSVAAALGTATLASGVSFVQNRINTTASFSFPTTTQANRDYGVFGPDFTFVSGVPEPSTEFSAGLGLLFVLGAVGVRRKYKA